VAFVQLLVLAAVLPLAFVDLVELGNRQVTGSHVVALPEPGLGQLASAVAVRVVAVASSVVHFEQDWAPGGVDGYCIDPGASWIESLDLVVVQVHSGVLEVRSSVVAWLSDEAKA